MATHSSVLAWIISGTGESGGCIAQSMGSHRVGHDWSDLAAAAAAAAAAMFYVQGIKQNSWGKTKQNKHIAGDSVQEKLILYWADLQLAAEFVNLYFGICLFEFENQKNMYFRLVVHNILVPNIQGPVSWKTFFQGPWWGGCFQDDSSALHLFCTLFLLLLYQFHLRSSDIRSRRLGTPVLDRHVKIF